MNKIERKDFLKIGWGTLLGGATGFVLSGTPFMALQWAVEWTQDQFVPSRGEEKALTTICEACPSKCTMSVRTFGDRAVQLNTSNRSCPLGQNALQLLYHPERIKQPLKRVGSKGSGKFAPVSWEEAIKDISGKMNELIKNNKGGEIASVSKDTNAASMLLERLVKKSGSNHNYFDASVDTLTTSTLNGVVEYDFEKTDFILSFGAKLLEGWGDQATINTAFNSWKKKGTKLFQVDTNNSRTASLADRWIPVKPGTEPILAMGIANYLITKKKASSGGRGFAQWSQIVINQYPLSTVSELTGVEQSKIKEIAEAFYRAKNPVAVAGKGASGVSSSSIEILAVHSLNTLVRTNSVKVKKYAGIGNEAIPATGSKQAAGLDDFIKNRSFEMLFVNGSDPVYKSVYGNDLKKKMEKAFVVSIMPLINDTAEYSDYILPTLSFMEKNGGTEGVVKDQTKGRHAGDIVLSIAKKVNTAAGAFPWAGYADVVKAEGAKRAAGNFSYNTDVLKKQITDLKNISTASSKFPLVMIPLELAVIGDGDGMAYPYVLKAIDQHTYADEKMWVQMNRSTGKKYGVSEGESIDIISEYGEIGSVKVHLTDIIAPEVVAVPLGFGHKSYTKYAKDKGFNVKEIMSKEIDPITGTANWWMTRVKIS